MTLHPTTPPPHGHWTTMWGNPFTGRKIQIVDNRNNLIASFVNVNHDWVHMPLPPHSWILRLTEDEAAACCRLLNEWEKETT